MSAEPRQLRRTAGRAADGLRPVTVEPEPLKFAEGSALLHLGDTQVLVAASLEKRVPPFLADTGRGWLTAEYSMLPRATPTRSAREVSLGRPSGRTAEIQRLIGRSLRAVMDLAALSEHTLILDCDVLQADGGTRTAAITGAYVAAVLALSRSFLSGDLTAWPVREQVAAVSVGILDGVPLLDLEACEDQEAEVDMNVVATAGGTLVEVQGTGERRSFSRQEMDQLLELASQGIDELTKIQSRVLAPTLAEVAAVQSKGRRTRARAKDESELWGKPD